MSLRTYRTFQALVLAALGIFFLGLIGEGQILNYIHSRLLVLIFLGALGLLLIAQEVMRARPAARLEPGEELSDDEDVHNTGGGAGLWWVALPVLVGLLLPARSLDGIWTAARLVSTTPAPGAASTPRTPEVLYLSPSSVPELWSVGLDGRAAHPWTSTGGNVVDFAAAPNGDFVVYSSRNELGGISLWRKDRSGGDVQLLLDCGEDHCSAPAIAPDSKQLAYARRQAGVAPGSSPAVGRIWLMELQTGETHPLSPDPNIAGSRPVWSPDGKWLSSYDELTNAQRVTNLQSGEEVVIPSEVDLPVEWTPDSSGLYYNNVVLGETVSYAVIFRFDLTSRRSEAAFGPENSLGDYNLPAISPAGDWLVVGLREVGGNPARQLWLMRLDGSERRQITSDPTVTVGAYRWSPDGTRVAFQTLEMGNSGARPKVMVWSKDGGEITLLVEDAAQPAWLP